MIRNFYLNHSAINAHFLPSPGDFCVTEIPLYDFSGQGEHLIITFRKKNLTTWEALDIFSSTLGCKVKEIGYAGLKDKNAMTVQSISVHKKYESRLKHLQHPAVKILNTTYHGNKIRTGHLKGNRFFARLKRVKGVDHQKIMNVLQELSTFGMPNFFGSQRFGHENKNYSKGQAILEGKLKVRSPKEREFLLNAYQSHLFNQWLNERIEISRLIKEFSVDELSNFLELDKTTLKTIKKQPHFFKIFEGDLLHHYPYGKLFELSSLETESQRFMQRDSVPTGLLSGKKVKRALSFAYEKYEKKYDIITSLVNGTRRYAWVYIDDMEAGYKEKENQLELNFSLPKGSYATVMIEQLLKKATD
jgi:tRNA pseudouridine13 synthase